MAFCVFCGADVPSSERTKEHILPMWLLKFTGDPHRRIGLGTDPVSGEQVVRPASSFHFPACDICNATYGRKLERHAKHIIEAISQGRSITVAQAYRLLDWLDKVRIGLWLGYHMLYRERRFVPKFHIDTRIGKRDRVAIIGVGPSDVEKALLFGGFDNNVFALTQCGIVLRINNIRILSFSFDFAVAKEAGLPFSQSEILRLDRPGFFETPIEFGSYSLCPTWPDYDGLNGVILAQPIVEPRSLPPERTLNAFFNSRVLERAKVAVRIRDPNKLVQTLPLQLISDEGGPLQYYPNKSARIHFRRPGPPHDTAYMVQLYALMLRRVMPLFPTTYRSAPDGELHTSVEQLFEQALCIYQIIARLAPLGPTPDMSELIQDLQHFQRVMDERSAGSNGTLVQE